MKNTTNVFLKGMTSDMHPLTTQLQEYTDALNATLVTFNGNEQMMQNDMGNTRIQDAKTGNIMGLREGFIPVGIKEHGGVIYIASVNKEGDGEIGTIPSPIIRFNLMGKDWETNDKLDKSNFIFSNGSIISNVIPVGETAVNPGEKFLIVFNDESDYSTKLKKNYYKIKLYSRTKDSDIDITDKTEILSSDISTKYIITDYTTPKDSDYWFIPNTVNINKLDLERMLACDQDCTKDTRYFIHYPYIERGIPAIALEKENIKSFNILPNYTNDTENGQLYPTLYYDKLTNTYTVCIMGFNYETDSEVTVDRIIMKLTGNGIESTSEYSHGDLKSISVNHDGQIIQDFVYLRKDVIGGKPIYIWYKSANLLVYTESKLPSKGDSVAEYLGVLDYGTVYSTYTKNEKNLSLTKLSDPKDNKSSYTNLLNDALLKVDLGSDCNKWLTLTVDYYCNKWPDTKLNTYTLKWNPYLLDILNTGISNIQWLPHSFNGQTLYTQYRDITKIDEPYAFTDHVTKTGELATINSDTLLYFFGTGQIGDSSLSAGDSNFVSVYDWPSTLLNFEYPDISIRNIDNYGKSTYLYLPVEVKSDIEGVITLSKLVFNIELETDWHNVRSGMYPVDKGTTGLKFVFSDITINNNPINLQNYEVEVYDVLEYLQISSTKVKAKVNAVISEKLDVAYDSQQIIVEGDPKQILLSMQLNKIQKKNITNSFVRNTYDNVAITRIKISTGIIIKDPNTELEYTIFVPNQSDCYVFPQFDLFVDKLEGNSTFTYPAYYNQTADSDSRIKISPINYLYNYVNIDSNLNVSSKETDELNYPSFTLDGYCDEKILVNKTIYSGNLSAGLYLARSSSGETLEVLYGVDTCTSNNGLLIYVDDYNKIVTLKSEKNTIRRPVGLYRVNVDLIDDNWKEKFKNNKVITFTDGLCGIYLQSVVCFKEKKETYLDYWRVLQPPSTQYKKYYKYDPVTAEGYLEQITEKSSDRDTKYLGTYTDPLHEGGLIEFRNVLTPVYTNTPEETNNEPPDSDTSSEIDNNPEIFITPLDQDNQNMPIDSL